MIASRVLVRAPNWLGDCVLCLGALRDIRRNFPSARIEVLARPSVAPLFGAVGEVDGVLESRGVGADAQRIRGRFDAAFVLPNSFGSALAPYLARIDQRLGYATDRRGLLLTRSTRIPPEVRGRSEVYYYRAMLAGVGLRTTASPEISMACPPAWSAAAAERLGREGPWIGLNPGAYYGSAKRWVPERYAAAADAVARRLDASVVLLGAAAERPLAAAIAGSIRSPTRILAGETSLPELVGVVSRLRLLLTNDSGPMHVASALGVPLVAIFGPTDWRETAPFGDGPHRLVREYAPCAPCKLRECPIDHRCMQRVTVERVVEEALELVS